MKKFLVALLVTVFALGMLTIPVGCAPETAGQAEQEAAEEAVEEAAAEETAEEPAAEPAAEEKDFVIGVVVKNASNPWHQRIGQGIEKFAADTGVNAFWKGPAKGDAAMQLEVIEDLLASGVDALCVVPIEPATLEPVLEKAMERGVVVITHEGASQQNTNYNVEAFKAANFGEYLADTMADVIGEEGKYTLVVDYLTNASQNDWADGVEARVEAAYPNIELLAEAPRVESQEDPEVAYEKTVELIKTYPDLKCIEGMSALVVPAAARAIEEMGLVGQVFTSGLAMPSHVQPFIKTGAVDSAGLWDPHDSGYAMCSLALKILNGEEITDGIDLGIPGYDNMELVGNQLLGQGWVTLNADNIDEMVETLGF